MHQFAKGFIRTVGPVAHIVVAGLAGLALAWAYASPASYSMGRWALLSMALPCIMTIPLQLFVDVEPFDDQGTPARVRNVFNKSAGCALLVLAATFLCWIWFGRVGNPGDRSVKLFGVWMSVAIPATAGFAGLAMGALMVMNGYRSPAARDWITATGAQPNGSDDGPTYEHISIEKDGSKHTSVFGWTAYGKRNVPPGGHIPKTTIEFEE